MELTKKEISVVNSLNTPEKVQTFVDNLDYNAGKRISIIDVLRKNKGDCLEASCFSSYILSKHKIENFIMDLSSVRDEDHVLCIFKRNGLYGAIGKSKFLGLRFRNPVYKNLRELSMSYFESYFNYFGEYTLREHSIPLKIEKIIKNKLDDVKIIVEIEKKLCEIKHVKLIDEIKLQRVPKIRFKREMIVEPKGKLGKRYQNLFKIKKKSSF